MGAMELLVGMVVEEEATEGGTAVEGAVVELAGAGDSEVGAEETGADTEAAVETTTARGTVTTT